MKQPNSKLLGFSILTSVISQVVIQLLFQVALGIIAINYPNIETAFNSISSKEHNGSVESMETTTLFLFTNFCYIGICIALSIGKPYRSGIIQNKAYIINLIGVVCLCVYVVYDPPEWLIILLQATPLPITIKITILEFGIAYSVICLLMEHLISKLSVNN